MGIRAVLWDMDGVLVDTGEFHYQAWAYTLRSHDILFSRERFQHTFGMNNWGTLITLFGKEPDQDFYNKVSLEKEAHFREIIHGQVRPLPGVLETLRLLKSKGVRQAIASSAPQENIDVLVDALALGEYFDAIVSGSQMPGKPAPDVFLAAARAVDISPQHCLVIEDAVTGVAGAKSAGMLCLAVTNTNPAEKLRQADYILDSLLELELDFPESMLELPPQNLDHDLCD